MDRIHKEMKERLNKGSRRSHMLMKLFFMLAALSIPVSILFDQEAIGMLLAMLLMLLGAYFSKTRFSK
jgi:hypothetical protein